MPKIDPNDLKRRNEILESQKDEIFYDFKYNLLSYRELARKYELSLYDIVKFLQKDEYINEAKLINEAKAIDYSQLMIEEADKIKEDSTNATVAKQRIKVETYKWLAKCTAPKLFNESFQVALENKNNEQQKEPLIFQVNLNKN